MKNNQENYPSFIKRVASVWYRHFRVYVRDFISNAMPPFVEPMIFLGGIGLGLGTYILDMNGQSYSQFLAKGLLVTSAMFTASFECTYGTYIRMEYDNIYDGMLAAPIRVFDLLFGEILWAGTKGMFFSTAVLSVFVSFGVISLESCLIAPIIGFFTGIMFSVLSLLFTSFVNNINYFNFYFTGIVSPMFFFSGIVFPTTNLPSFLQPIIEFLPLTHSIRLIRRVSSGEINNLLLLDVLYILAFCIIVGYLAIKRLNKRLID